MMFEGLYHHRDPAAIGGAVLVMIALWLSWQHLPAAKPRAALQDETVITMEELPAPLPEPPPPPPPKAEPPRPSEPKPVSRPAPTPAPVAAPTPSPVAAPTATPAAVPVPQALPPPPAPAPAPPPKPASVPTANQENRYLAELRSYINSIKRYPTSREARQLRPTGIVKVWIELDREGQIINAGVETASDSMLLDREALRTVRNGRYPAFPSEAFAGQGTHRFVVPIEYVIDGTT